MTEVFTKNDYRDLGDTGIKVSPVGLGTVKIGRNEQVKYPASFSIPDDKEVSNLLSLAQELGINLIDTAPAYGNSEERLGKLITNRTHWKICSKVGEEFIDGKSVFNFSARHTEKSIERSLKRLGTDFIDIALIHSDGKDMDIINNGETITALQKMKVKGYLGAIGFSGKTVEGGIAALDSMDIVMVTYNLNECSEEQVIDRAGELNKGVLIKKALASGHICIEGNPDPVQASMDFVLAKESVSSAILGTINPEHLCANVTAAVNAIRKSG